MSINIKKDGKLVKIAPTSYNELTDLPNIESSGDVTYITDESGKNVATIGPGGISTTGIVVDRITLDGEDVGSRLDEIKGEIDFNDLTNNPISDNNDGTVSFADENGNKIVLIDSKGVTSVEFKADGHKLTEKADQSYVQDQITRLEASAFSGDYNDLENAPIINDTTGSAIFADEKGNQIAKIDSFGITTTNVAIKEGDVATLIGEKADQTSLDATNNTITATNATVSTHTTEIGNLKTEVANDKTALETFKTETAGNFTAVNKSISDTNDAVDVLENKVSINEEKLEGVQASDGEFTITDGTNIGMKLDSEGLLHVREVEVAGGRVDERLKDIENYFSTEEDADSNLNKWHEIVNFLNGFEETDQVLENIIATKASNDTVNALDAAYKAADKTIGQRIDNVVTDYEAADAAITTAYTTADSKLQADINTRALQSSLDATNQEVNNIKEDYVTKVALASEVETQSLITDAITLNEDEFIFADDEGYKIAEINSTGITSVEFVAGEHQLTKKADKTYVDAQFSSTNASLESMASTIRNEFAEEDLKLSNKISEVETAYKAADVDLQKDIATRALQTSLDATNQKVSTIESTYATKAEVAKKVETELLVADDITLNKSEFVFADEAGNKIAEINNTGVNSVDFIAGTHKLTEKANKSDVENQITSTNTSIETVASAIRKEFAAEDTKLSTKISEIDAAYKAEDTKIKEDVASRALQTSLDATNERVSDIENTYVTKEEIATKVETNLLVADDITLNKSEYVFSDANGNKIAQIDSAGINSTEFVSGDHKLTSKADKTYVDQLNTNVGETINNTASAIRNEFKIKDDELSGKITKVETEYKAADTAIQEEVDKRALQTALDSTNQEVSNIKNNYVTKAEIATEVDTAHLIADNITLNQSEYIFKDNTDKKIAQIDASGVSSTEFTAGSHQLTKKADMSYVGDQVTSINSSITTTAAAIRKEFADVDSELSNRIDTINVEYQAADDTLQSAIDKKANQTAVDAANSRIDTIANTYATKEEIATEVDTDHLIADRITLNDDTFIFTDNKGDGHKIAEINSEGITSVDFIAGTEGEHKLTLKADTSYVNDQITALDTTITNTASTIRNEFAAKDVELSGKITTVETNYKSADEDIKLAYAAADKTIENKITALETSIGTSISTGNITATGTIKANKIITDDFELKQDSYQFADSNGNKIAEISSNGLSTTKVQIAEGDVATLLDGKVDDETFNNSISNLETNKVSNSALTETLKSYALKGEIPSLDGYLKETVADGKYATITTTNNLQNSINSVNTNLSTRLGTAEGNITSVGNRVSTLEGYFATAEDPDDIINKWTDVVEFLDGMAEGNTDGEKLDAILAAKANQASLDATNNRIDTIEDDYVTKAEIAAEVKTEHLEADNITLNQDSYIFTDGTNKIAEIDESGIIAVDFIAKDGDKLTDKADKSSVDALDSKIDNLTTSDVSEGTNKYFTNARVKSAITGSASTIVDTDLTASRVLITNGSKKVAVSSITSTKLGYLTDVTSNIQAQLNGKVATATVTALDTRVGTIEGYFSNAAAKKVSKSFIVKVSGTQMHSYNGSAEKIVNFKAGNNISLTFEGNDITITGTAQSTDVSGLESRISALEIGKQDVITNLSTITNNAANGATAYGWGDHASKGYLTKTAADGYYAPKSSYDTVKSTPTTSKYYLCGSLYNTENTSVLYKRSDVYVNNAGSIYGKSFFETSDETLKNFSNNVEVDFEKLLKLPKKYFTWKDGDDTQHIGTSAQEVQKIYPELVSEGSEGKLTVDYAKLSIVALKAIDELYIKNLELEERLSKIETLLNIK